MSKKSVFCQLFLIITIILAFIMEHTYNMDIDTLKSIEQQKSYDLFASPLFSVKSYDWELEYEFVIPGGVGFLGWIYRPYPGAYLDLCVYITNTGSSRLYIYGVDFEFENVPYCSWLSDFESAIYVDPGEKKAVGSEIGDVDVFGISDATLCFQIPSEILPGSYSIRVGLYQYHEEWYGWVDDGLVWGQWYSFYVYDPPKIEIISVDFDKETTMGESLHVSVTIKNTGDCVAKKVRIRAYVDGSSLPSARYFPDTVTGLNPDESYVIEFDIYEDDYLTSGMHTLGIVAEMIPGLTKYDSYEETDSFETTFYVEENYAKEKSLSNELLLIMAVIVAFVVALFLFLQNLTRPQIP